MRDDNLSDTAPPGSTQYLTFLLGAEAFALDIRGVREIIQPVALTPVPLMPAFVRGVINLRGAVVPVIDLQARFGRPPATVGKKTCIVIFDAHRDGEHVALGLMVDAVSEVIDIDGALLEPPPEFGCSVRRDFVRAMGRHQGRFVAVLESDTAFDVEDMAQRCDDGLALVAA
jgi:purine-binding chemotaxis protein CheW